MIFIFNTINKQQIKQKQKKQKNIIKVIKPIKQKVITNLN
jgi:hypothetical protein